VRKASIEHMEQQLLLLNDEEKEEFAAAADTMLRLMLKIDKNKKECV